MSRKTRAFRVFLHQNQNPTVKQAWDAAWKRAQKTFYTQSMRDMEEKLAAAQAECERLRKDAERYQSLLEAVLREIPHRKGRRGNAPGHAHSVPGIWDEDNGALAGKECAWCKVWNEAVSAMQRNSGGAA